jgi:two-component system, chemotaxis family, protein-glutamate methylesterase/glutaminase
VIRPAAGKTRVLICEDSRTYAAALRRLLEHDGSIEVVGVHGTAEAALAALPSERPDLITMDLDLPGMGGLEAVEHIMSVQPVPLLVISSHVGPGRAQTAAALAAGALEAIAKDDLDLAAVDGAAGAAFRRRVHVLAGARLIRHPRARLRRRVTLPRASRRREPAEVIGVVASTGGPQALVYLLGQLPADFSVPLLVVQHIAAGFTAGLATWLDGAVPIRVQLADEDTPLAPGVWIAPEDAHLIVGPDRTLALDRRTRSGLHRPSGDMLLASLAERAGPAGVAVVLTGMGTDGARGIAAVRAAGGLTIAQDEESSAIYGMPKAAAENGVELVLPLDEIAPTLAALGSRRR